MALGRDDGLNYAIGDGYSALDAKSSRDRLDGYAVVDGLAVTVSSGLTLSIASGTATVGSTSGSVDTVSLGSSTTTTLSSADSTHPRKDTVYIDTGGLIQVEQGTAEAAAPGGNDRFDTFEPEPPLPSTEGVILAEVWVPAGASSLSGSDVRDRRQPAQAVVDEVDAQAVTAERLGINTYDLIQDANPEDEQLAIVKNTDINGSLVWEFTDPSDNVRSSPTVVDGVLYVGSHDNSVYAVSAVERFARMYVADTHGWVPLHKGPNEITRPAGSTQTGNYAPIKEDFEQ